MTSADSLAAAQRILERADELATHSQSPDGIDRRFLTPQHAAVNALAAGWMEEAGLTTWVDEAGNLCGRRAVDPDGRPSVLLGSHLDTVPGAGRYDGILGVLLAIEVAARLRTAELEHALEVVAFADEEGTRFGATLLGSRALAGTWQPEWSGLADEDGVTLSDAAHAFGLDAARIPDAAREPGSVAAYLEAHIEQGPRLEALDQPLGVVSSIAAAERRIITVLGETRHGATPWELRKDALAGASEAITAVERLARLQGSYATVGHIRVEPDAVNVIPGVAEFSLDLRDETADARDHTWSLIKDEFDRIAADRSLHVEARSFHRAPEVVCAPELRAAIADAILGTGHQAPELYSVAGHDAMAIAALAPVGMLFVRCAGGISHHRDEAVSLDDVAVALDAFEAAVRGVAG